MPDLAAIIFFPENFIFSAVKDLRLCKTFSCDPSHYMLSQNPPPKLRTVCGGLRETDCDGIPIPNTNFSEKNIIVGSFGEPATIV